MKKPVLPPHTRKPAAGSVPTDDAVAAAVAPVFPEVPTPPLPVAVVGPVHTVPNPATRVIAFQVVINNKSTRIAGKDSKRRAIQIISHAAGTDYVNVQGQAMQSLNDGAGMFANGAGFSIDTRDELFGWATTDGIMVSVFTTVEDG